MFVCLFLEQPRFFPSDIQLDVIAEVGCLHQVLSGKPGLFVASMTLWGPMLSSCFACVCVLVGGDAGHVLRFVGLSDMGVYATQSQRVQSCFSSPWSGLCNT